MKNYNKILEAVNRGIQLALDDFNDEEQVQHVKSKQIQNRDYTKEYLDLMKETVDLKLPSGTLWCKYNLDVNPKQLSKPEDWYGRYYAWGDVETKSDYSWYNYKFGKNYNRLIKYCNDPGCGLFGLVDNLTELQPEDDAAYQNKKLYNYKFHIPTKEQYEELINYTDNYWVNNYNPNKLVHNPKDDGGIQELNGRVFEGKNGNQMFIPAAGFYRDSNASIGGSYCYLWSSSLCVGEPNNAYSLYFSLGTIDVDGYNRFFGHSIRPVINL